jgi:hypothetical protein
MLAKYAVIDTAGRFQPTISRHATRSRVSGVRQTLKEIVKPIRRCAKRGRMDPAIQAIKKIGRPSQPADSPPSR